MTYRTRILAVVLTAAMLPVWVLTPTPARASEEGRRNTALGLGAVSLYLLSRKDTRWLGVAGAGGTLYATKLYYDDINKRHKRERAALQRRANSQGYASRSSYGSAHTAALSARPDIQAMISSAYKKGMSAGYNNGYRQGIVQARTVNPKAAPISAPKKPAGTGAYDRVLVAMRG